LSRSTIILFKSSIKLGQRSHPMYWQFISSHLSGYSRS